MAEVVRNEEFFHINRRAPYSPYPPMKVGDRIESGKATNPFFGFYERYFRTYQVNDNDAGGQVQIGAMKLMEYVRDGKATGPTMGQTSFEIANHFFMLARELIWENVRLEGFPDAPSRKTCMWLIPSLDATRRWVEKLSAQGQPVVRLWATGRVLRADSNHLPRDSEALPRWLERAQLYWGGMPTTDPIPETLFQGLAEVKEILSTNVEKNKEP